MKKNLLNTIVLALIALLAIPNLKAEQNDAETTYEFNFIISSDIKTPTPATDAIISLGETVNEAGNYIFNVPAGTYKYIIKKEGSATTSGKITIPGNLVDKTSPDVNMIVMLYSMAGFTFPVDYFYTTNLLPGEPAAYAYTFDLKDEAGVAIDAAAITFNGEVLASNTATVEAGIYEYTIEKEGFETLSGKAIVVGDETQELSMSVKMYEFNFIVSSSVMPPTKVGDAVISLGETVNEVGNYNFNVPAGTYKYIVKKEGSATESGEIIIPEGLIDVTSEEGAMIVMMYPNFGFEFPFDYFYQQALFSGTPATYAYTFDLKDEAGMAITDAEITFNGEVLTSNTATVEAGIYEYTIAKEGFETLSGKAIVVGDETQEVVMIDSRPVGCSINSFNTMLYPNPFSDYIAISSDLEVETISICDISGRLMDVIRLNGASSISTASLPTGVYFITLHDAAGNKSVGKVVKK